MDNKMKCPFARKECMGNDCQWMTLMVDDTTGTDVACCSVEMIAYTLEAIKDLIANGACGDGV